MQKIKRRENFIMAGNDTIPNNTTILPINYNQASKDTVSQPKAKVDSLPKIGDLLNNEISSTKATDEILSEKIMSFMRLDPNKPVKIYKHHEDFAVGGNKLLLEILQDNKIYGTTPLTEAQNPDLYKSSMDLIYNKIADLDAIYKKKFEEDFKKFIIDAQKSKASANNTVTAQTNPSVTDTIPAKPLVLSSQLPVISSSIKAKPLTTEDPILTTELQNHNITTEASPKKDSNTTIKIIKTPNGKEKIIVIKDGQEKSIEDTNADDLAIKYCKKILDNQNKTDLNPEQIKQNKENLKKIEEFYNNNSFLPSNDTERETGKPYYAELNKPKQPEVKNTPPVKSPEQASTPQSNSTKTENKTDSNATNAKENNFGIIFDGKDIIVKGQKINPNNTEAIEAAAKNLNEDEVHALITANEQAKASKEPSVKNNVTPNNVNLKQSSATPVQAQVTSVPSGNASNSNSNSDPDWNSAFEESTTAAQSSTSVVQSSTPAAQSNSVSAGQNVDTSKPTYAQTPLVITLKSGQTLSGVLAKNYNITKPDDILLGTKQIPFSVGNEKILKKDTPGFGADNLRSGDKVVLPKTLTLNNNTYQLQNIEGAEPYKPASEPAPAPISTDTSAHKSEQDSTLAKKVKTQAENFQISPNLNSDEKPKTAKERIAAITDSSSYKKTKKETKTSYQNMNDLMTKATNQMQAKMMGNFWNQFQKTFGTDTTSK